MTVTNIKKYVPGEDVILDCNIITSNHKIAWVFENEVIWTGDKLNIMSINSLRYEITEELNLRIKNTSIHDEGKYTGLLIPPSQDGKCTVTLESEQIREMKNNSNSNHSLESDGHESGQWIVYSLISMSIISSILLSLLCVLFYKYRKSHYNRSDSGIHNFASESVEMNDNPHVYNIIDENQLDDLMHDQADNVATASEGTHSSDQSDDDLIQYEKSEYLHPYHSLVPVIDAEKQDYEQIKVQNKENVYVYEDIVRIIEQIITQVHPVSEKRTFCNSDLTSPGVPKKICNTHFANKASGSSYNTNQPEQNNQFESIRVNISNVTKNCNRIPDNISLD
ncbi:unnamed protein product [Mytilus coruscus]|uniref:Ig-like domain-containing protein n=1 Tax=Mytilus coruscus TaxID=42192 RepID=A0A6J8DK57_MYTCO|nr:unnamed protein product [Mytilus coruscus]